MDELHDKVITEWKKKSDEELLFEAGKTRTWETAPVEIARRLKNGMLENKKSIDKFNIQSSRLAKIMISIAVLQIIIMALQIVIMLKRV